MNSKLESENNVLTANSRNGKLLKETVDEQSLHVLNFDPRCEGKWTHVIRTTGSSSVLDYVITDSTITKCVREIIIDEDCLYCPFWIKKKNKEVIPQFSDHNSILTTLHLPYIKNKQSNRPKSWKITEEGLANFSITTNDLTFPIDVAGTGQTKYDGYERLLAKTMDLCFQKSKPKPEKKVHHKFAALNRRVRLFAKKGKAQRKVASTYIKAMINANTEMVSLRNKENISNTLRNITIDNSFSPSNFWEL